VSVCVEAHRYTLTRSGWFGGRGHLVWVMLNPSTADDTHDDPTIRRVIRFTRDHNYERLTVVNLFSARATKPLDLVDMAEHGCDPSWLNDGPTLNAIRGADAVVAAWGATVPRRLARLHAARVRFVLDSCVYADREPLCLGVTADGHPRHPLYVPSETRLVPLHMLGVQPPGEEKRRS